MFMLLYSHEKSTERLGMEKQKVPFEEVMLASAVNFLLSEDEKEAAITLLSCAADLIEQNEHEYILYLRGPRHIYTALKDRFGPLNLSISNAFNAVFPIEDHLKDIFPLANVVDVEPNWKEQMLDIAMGKQVHNQGVDIDNRVTIVWKSLRFRSESEKKIAEALDRANVLFLPNCLARLGPTTAERQNKEADFLVCSEGKWGILEVDGEAFHTTAAKDHDRDRLFRFYGIRVIERFTATECYNTPEKVVQKFLTILKKNA